MTRAMVREAVAVFEDAASLEAAVEELEAAGFSDEDLSILAAERAVEAKLGHRFERVEELEDDPAAPRARFIPAKQLAENERSIVGSMTVLPTLLAAGAVVASAGAVAAAIVATAVAGALLGTALAQLIDRKHAERLVQQLESGGILLWVRTPDEIKERQALAILTRYAAHDVHIHEIPAPDAG